MKGAKDDYDDAVANLRNYVAELTDKTRRPLLAGADDDQYVDTETGEVRN